MMFFQAAMNLTDAQKRQIVENRRKLLLSLEEVGGGQLSKPASYFDGIPLLRLHAA